MSEDPMKEEIRMKTNQRTFFRTTSASSNTSGKTLQSLESHQSSLSRSSTPLDLNSSAPMYATWNHETNDPWNTVSSVLQEKCGYCDGLHLNPMECPVLQAASAYYSLPLSQIAALGQQLKGSCQRCMGTGHNAQQCTLNVRRHVNHVTQSHIPHNHIPQNHIPNYVTSNIPTNHVSSNHGTHGSLVQGQVAHQTPAQTSGGLKCFQCGEPNHTSANCPKLECFTCGGKHFARSCPLRRH